MDSGCSSKTYCVNLFAQVATDTLGYLKPCCQFEAESENPHWRKIHIEEMGVREFFNSEEIQVLRQRAREGKKISGCDKCYELEEAGLKSMRVRDNFNHGDLVEKVRDEIHQETIYSFDFRAGNLCNMGCVMCNPSSSSKLDSLFKQYGSEKFSNRFKDLSALGSYRNHSGWYKDESIVEQILNEVDQLEKLWMVGGEPLINKTNFQLLDKLSHRAKNLNLEISTNLAVMNPEIIEILEKFDTSLKCSVDGTNEVFNYIRYPGDFQKIESHLKQVLQSNIEFDIVFTVSVLNMFNIPDFVCWMNGLGEQFDKKISIGLSNIVSFPDYLDIRNLPEKTKSEATQQLEQFLEKERQLHKVDCHRQIKSLVQFLNSPGDFQVLKKGWKYLENFDRARGLSWKSIVPQLVPHLEESSAEASL